MKAVGQEGSQGHPAQAQANDECLTEPLKLSAEMMRAERHENEQQATNEQKAKAGRDKRALGISPLQISARGHHHDVASLSFRSKIRVVTYNVHGFVGTDGVYQPERIARVLERSEADVMALQEVDAGTGRGLDSHAYDWLADRLGMTCHFRLTRPGKYGPFGNAVFTKRRFEVVAEGLLPHRRDEPRAAQWLRIEAGSADFDLLNTHLSIKEGERNVQLQSLVGAEWLLRHSSERPLILCGDFNTTPWSKTYRELSRSFTDVQKAKPARRRATWPARFPLLRLDHVFVPSTVEVEGCHVLDHAEARVASDHLPLVADLWLPTASKGNP